MNRSFRAELTPGNVSPKSRHLPTGALRDFLHARGVFGAKNKNDGLGREITIRFKGKEFRTDIPADKPTIFRNRTMAREFLEDYEPRAGETILYEEVAPLVFEAFLERDAARRQALDKMAGALHEAGSADRMHGADGVPMPPVAEPDQAPALPREADDGKDAIEVDAERIRRWAVARPDQAQFRRDIAKRDGLQCAVTGCDVSEALEAAHLHPRAAGGSDDISNGIILRADLHRLLDAGLLLIDPATTRISISCVIVDTAYRALDGMTIRTGADLSNLRHRETAEVAP